MDLGQGFVRLCAQTAMIRKDELVSRSSRVSTVTQGMFATRTQCQSGRCGVGPSPHRWQT